ncbi:type II toxin-antitoxin system PemK/MazF family toxin [Rosistilla oblonga]|uniref:mRNA interferase MazF n=1 Tax=Rosistilla oblonga TaxID=2527990 RepID=A0A518IUH2_9BACT|nr:type II toxin-antitoxin system PemK/MazF family toxin [Rosistilla oblonga]QDV56727.1 mRNA interferase MazF [Rosistilla oblonga]
MNVGDIHWVDFPRANGREQQGRRPAIIMQEDRYAGGLPTALVVPLSTAIRALRFAGTTTIAASSESGLGKASVALVFQLRAIDRGRIREKMGHIGDAGCEAVFNELSKLLGRSI